MARTKGKAGRNVRDSSRQDSKPITAEKNCLIDLKVRQAKMPESCPEV